MNSPLHIILLVVQFITISVYVYAVTFLVASRAFKGDLGVLGPSYLTILIFFFLILVAIGNEAVFIIRQNLNPDLYRNSQVVKIALFITTLLSVELYGLAWKKRDVNNVNTMLTGIIGLTLIASVPFILGLVMAWNFQRSHGCGISIVVTAVDEEAGERRPLLHDRAYTT
ncbi:hypothetical protein ONS95_001737 [Cadophora gregata]|uniref:uncharacterized protein n=1 Tax=Cadophora gregata TaxID=51156 RepID=UPI0026DD67E5|nr:uncharacterized protein ONS95_001737 [Cadophora gregata]KAK0111375.1 hypothetical protein ONS95_001737 [Cadophora gregata]